MSSNVVPKTVPFGHKEQTGAPKYRPPVRRPRPEPMATKLSKKVPAELARPFEPDLRRYEVETNNWKLELPEEPKPTGENPVVKIESLELSERRNAVERVRDNVFAGTLASLATAAIAGVGFYVGLAVSEESMAMEPSPPLQQSPPLIEVPLVELPRVDTRNEPPSASDQSDLDAMLDGTPAAAMVDDTELVTPEPGEQVEPSASTASSTSDVVDPADAEETAPVVVEPDVVESVVAGESTVDSVDGESVEAASGADASFESESTDCSPDEIDEESQVVTGSVDEANPVVNDSADEGVNDVDQLDEASMGDFVDCLFGDGVEGEPVESGVVEEPVEGIEVPNPETPVDVVEPDVVDPDVVEPSVVEPNVVEPDVVEPSVVEPVEGIEVVEPDVVEPDVVEPDAVEPDVVEPDVVEPDVVEPDAVEPDVVESVEGIEVSESETPVEIVETDAVEAPVEGVVDSADDESIENESVENGSIENGSEVCASFEGEPAECAVDEAVVDGDQLNEGSMGDFVDYVFGAEVVEG